MKARQWLAALVVLIFVALFISVIVQDDEARFIEAVQNGDIDAVSAMLKKNNGLTHIEQHHKAGSTPILYIAISRGHNEIVRLLLSHGASLKEYLGTLRYTSDPEMAQLLIDYGADVNWRNEKNSNRAALHFFAATDNTELIELLLDHGADVNIKSRGGETPLHQAAREGHLNAVKLLISKEADVNIKSRENKTPFDCAVFPVWNEDAYHVESGRINRCKEVAAFLLDYEPAYTISDIVWLGDMDRLANMIKDDPNVVNLPANGEFPLFAAIRGNNPEAVEYLLTHGAQPDATGRFKQSPLQLAAYMGYTDIAKVILDHGADIDEKGRCGETALHWAAVKGNADTVSLLLEHGANPNSMTSGYTIDLNIGIRDNTDPIEFEFRRFDMEQAILRAKRINRPIQVAPPPKLAFTQNDTPLHAACYWNHIDIVRLLIDNGSNINAVNTWGATALHYAVVCRYYDIAQLLLDRGADPKAKALNGMTPVEIARKLKDEKLVKILTDKE